MKLHEIAANFGRFLPSQILRGAVPPKLYPRHHASLAARHLEKFGEVPPPSPKVIGAHAPNFMPIFECSLLKIVGGTPITRGVCATKPWSFSSMCKNLSQQRPIRAKIWSSEKVYLGVSGSACSTMLLVDQSSPGFFRRTQEESLLIMSSQFWISLSVPEMFAIEL